MKNKRQQPNRTNKAFTKVVSLHRQHIVTYYRDILLAIFVFLLRDKGPSTDVRRIVMRQLEEAERLTSQARREAHTQSGVLGAVLHEWHRNRRYLDKNYLPLAIPLSGSAPSVAALVRSQEKGVNPDSVAKSMVKLQLIRKLAPDRYTPVGRVATIRKLSPALIEHVASSLERLLETVNFNTRGRDARNSLIERTAFVHDLPAGETRAFRAFAQEQGSAFLANADEWLESRRAPKSSKAKSPVIRAGIHVYAFEEKHQQRRSLKSGRKVISSTHRATPAG